MFLRDICNQPSCKLSQKQTELQLSMRLSRGHPVLSVSYVTRGGKASLHSAMTQDDNDFVYSAGIFCLLLFSTKSFLVFIDFLSIFIIIHTFFTTAQNFNICVLHLKKKKNIQNRKKTSLVIHVRAHLLLLRKKLPGIARGTKEKRRKASARNGRFQTRLLSSLKVLRILITP